MPGARGNEVVSVTCNNGKPGSTVPATRVPHTATIKSIILLGSLRGDPHVSRQPMFLAFRTLITTAIVSASLVAAQTSGPAAAVSPSADRETLRRYCVACHNAKVKTSGIALDSME